MDNNKKNEGTDSNNLLGKLLPQYHSQYASSFAPSDCINKQ